MSDFRPYFLHLLRRLAAGELRVRCLRPASCDPHFQLADVVFCVFDDAGGLDYFAWAACGQEVFDLGGLETVESQLTEAEHDAIETALWSARNEHPDLLEDQESYLAWICSGSPDVAAPPIAPAAPLARGIRPEFGALYNPPLPGDVRRKFLADALTEHARKIQAEDPALAGLPPVKVTIEEPTGPFGFDGKPDGAPGMRPAPWARESIPPDLVIVDDAPPLENVVMLPSPSAAGESISIENTTDRTLTVRTLEGESFRVPARERGRYIAAIEDALREGGKLLEDRDPIHWTPLDELRAAADMPGFSAAVRARQAAHEAELVRKAAEIQAEHPGRMMVYETFAGDPPEMGRLRVATDEEQAKLEREGPFAFPQADDVDTVGSLQAELMRQYGHYLPHSDTPTITDPEDIRPTLAKYMVEPEDDDEDDPEWDALWEVVYAADALLDARGTDGETEAWDRLRDAVALAPWSEE